MTVPTAHDVENAQRLIERVRAEVARVYSGSPNPLERMMVALLAKGHALLEGVPGVAKTTLVKTFATVLGCTTKRVQFTADLLPSDITGTFVYSPRDGSFQFRAGPVFANVVLADEINRAPAKTQAALLEAMQERQVTAEGQRFELPTPFFVLATENPIDFEGTYPLPEAQIDRFLVRITMGYPSPSEEVVMLRTHAVHPPTVTPQLDAEGVFRLQEITSSIHVEEDVLVYAVNIATATRTDSRVALGASPRATLSLVQASKAFALMHGRSYVVPDDVRHLAPDVLAHRLVLSGDYERNESSRVRIVDEVLQRVTFRRGARG